MQRGRPELPTKDDGMRGSYQLLVIRSKLCDRCNNPTESVRTPLSRETVSRTRSPLAEQLQESSPRGGHRYGYPRPRLGQRAQCFRALNGPATTPQSRAGDHPHPYTQQSVCLLRNLNLGVRKGGRLPEGPLLP